MNSYEKAYIVTANEIDKNYCLSASGILLYLQDSIASFMATWRAAAFDISEEGLIWVVLEYSIEVTENIPVWSNEVRVLLSVTEITPMRTYFDFTMSDHNGAVFSKGSSVWTLLDSSTRHPYTESLEYVTKKSGICLRTPLQRHSRIRFPKSENVIVKNQYTTQVTDVDFNGHVCNRTYLSVALGCFEKCKYIKNLVIKYVKETYLGDTLNVVCSYDDTQGVYVCDIQNSENETVCSLGISFWDTDQIIDVKNLVARI